MLSVGETPTPPEPDSSLYNRRYVTLGQTFLSLVILCLVQLSLSNCAICKDGDFNISKPSTSIDDSNNPESTSV